MTPELNIQAFRAAYPQFANEDWYPNAYIEAQWNAGAGFIATSAYGCAPGNSQLIRDLMCAHLLATLGPAVPGMAPAAPGAITSSTIDKVTVARAAPPVKGPWAHWLSSTQYGVMLWALLKSRVAGGFYAVGRNEQAMFRRAPGIRR